MGRPRKATPPDATDLEQPALPGTATPKWRGPVERSIAKAIRAGEFEDLDAAAVALLRSSARVVDSCERNGERHTHTMAVARMSELLTKLRLEPSARGEGVSEPDAWDHALANLGTATSGHPEI